MPDPVSKVEIEDVLSSIRRLVSEEPLPSRRRAAMAEAKDRLVLTPAQRVGDSDDDADVTDAAPAFEDETDVDTSTEAEAVSDAEPASQPEGESAPADTSSIIHLTNPVTVAEPEPNAETVAYAPANDAGAADVTPKLSLEARIAGLEAALVRSGGTWEPDGSEDGTSDETRPLSADANYDFLADWEREAAAAALAEAEDEADTAEAETADITPETAAVEASDTALLLTEEHALIEVPDVEDEPAERAEVKADAEAEDAETSLFADEADQPADEAAAAETDDELVALSDDPAEPVAEDEADEVSEADDQIDIVASIDRFLAEAEEKEAAEDTTVQEAPAETVAEDAEAEDEVFALMKDVDDEPEVEDAAESKSVPEPEPEAIAETDLEAEAPAEPEEVAGAEAESSAESEPDASDAPEPEAEIAFFTARRPAPQPVEEQPAADWEDFEDVASFEDYSGVDETVDAFAEETDDLDGTLADDTLDDDIPDAQDESVFASEEAVLDEEALREMVAELVREELQGVLGERITRNVRRLVRREIERALALRDLSS